MNIYIYIFLFWGKSIVVTNIKIQTFVGQSTEGVRKRVSFRWGDVEGRFLKFCWADVSGLRVRDLVLSCTERWTLKEFGPQPMQWCKLRP